MQCYITTSVHHNRGGVQIGMKGYNYMYFSSPLFSLSLYISLYPSLYPAHLNNQFGGPRVEGMGEADTVVADSPLQDQLIPLRPPRDQCHDALVVGAGLDINGLIHRPIHTNRVVAPEAKPGGIRVINKLV